MTEAKKRILIVDDEPLIVETLRVALEQAGFECLEAVDGIEAIAETSKAKPDCILLDVMLPKMNGYKVCRLLKFDEKFKHIPIIMLTARTQEKDRALGLETGADEYVTKPFDMAGLIELIGKYTGKA